MRYFVSAENIKKEAANKKFLRVPSKDCIMPSMREN